VSKRPGHCAHGLCAAMVFTPAVCVRFSCCVPGSPRFASEVVTITGGKDLCLCHNDVRQGDEVCNCSSPARIWNHTVAQQCPAPVAELAWLRHIAVCSAPHAVRTASTSTYMPTYMHTYVRTACFCGMCFISCLSAVRCWLTCCLKLHR